MANNLSADQKKFDDELKKIRGLIVEIEGLNIDQPSKFYRQVKLALDEIDWSVRFGLASDTRYDWARSANVLRSAQNTVENLTTLLTQLVAPDANFDIFTFSLTLAKEAEDLRERAKVSALAATLRFAGELEALKSELDQKLMQTDSDLTRLKNILDRSVTQRASDLLDSQAMVLAGVGIFCIFIALTVLGITAFYGPLQSPSSTYPVKPWATSENLPFISSIGASAVFVAVLLKLASVSLHNAFLSFHRSVTLRRLNELAGDQLDISLLSHVVPAAARALFDVQPTGFFRSSARAQAGSSGVSVSYENSGNRNEKSD